MESRFDLMTKLFAGEGSRREMLKRFGGLLGGASLISLAASCEQNPVAPRIGEPARDLVPPGRCKLPGQNCREHLECCSQFCDPTTATCACQAGTFECPSSGQCVSCPMGQVLNPATCQCECGPGFETCGNTSNQGLFCCQGQFSFCCRSSSSNLDTCCPTDWKCCDSPLNPFCCQPGYSCCVGGNFNACCPPGTRCARDQFGNPTCTM